MRYGGWSEPDKMSKRKICFCGWEDVKRCGFTDSNAIYAAWALGRRMADKVLEKAKGCTFSLNTFRWI